MTQIQSDLPHPHVSRDDDIHGVAGRQNRYQAISRRLLSGLRELGFETFLSDEYRAHIITSLLCPGDEKLQMSSNE